MTKRKQPRAGEPKKTAKKQQKPRSRPSSRGRPAAQESYLYGLHAVTEALANPKRHPERLICTANTARDLEARKLLGRIAPEIATSAEIGALLPPGAVHQGIALKTPPLPEPDLDSVAAKGGRIALLDQVTDPHNVGAILRSAAVFGLSAIVMTERNSAPQSGVLAKSASGALEHVPICRVGNFARAIETLKKQGFTIVGLDGDATEELSRLDLAAPLALVLGAEGAGLRRLTREHCDWLAKLPASGPLRSLNVSNAAAVAFYELARRD